MQQNTLNYEFPSPKVVIPRDVYTKLMFWVNKGGSHECSGLGKTVFEDGKIKVVDAWMVKQKNTGGTTDMDEDAIGTLLYDKRETLGSMNFWWHSHANMGVFWSSTDRNQITKIASEGFCLAIVFNTKKEHLACVAFGSPVPMYVNGVSVTIEENVDASVVEAWKSEYDSAVQKNAVVHRSTLGLHYEGWNDDYWSDRVASDKGTALTSHRPIGFPKTESENQDQARVRRLKELDDQSEALDVFFETAAPIVPDSIKKIIGASHISIDDPYMEFEILPGNTTTLFQMAWDKVLEIDEELGILVGKK
jgi:proteasome lid subunit RPN8/RPN11